MICTKSEQKSNPGRACVDQDTLTVQMAEQAVPASLFILGISTPAGCPLMSAYDLRLRNRRPAAAADAGGRRIGAQEVGDPAVGRGGRRGRQDDALCALLRARGQGLPALPAPGARRCLSLIRTLTVPCCVAVVHFTSFTKAGIQFSAHWPHFT